MIARGVPRLGAIFRKNGHQLKDQNFEKQLLFEAEQKYIKKQKGHFNSVL